MPQKDIYHDTVVNALKVDQWVITHDPLRLAYGGRELYAELGAEQPIGAEKEGKRIAVEIKSFVGASGMHDLEVALGQFNLYRAILAELEPDRVLYLAIPLRAFRELFLEPLGELVIRRQALRLIVFDEKRKRIDQCIPPT
jgi:hypothetical protein